MSNLATIDTEELKAMYANAKTTFGQCGGHAKAERNEYLMDKYATELGHRGVDIESIPAGTFNGPGSS